MSFNKPISLARLSSISWDEPAVRAQQETLKRWEAASQRLALACRSDVKVSCNARFGSK